MSQKGNEELRKNIWKIALLNALGHDGKAQTGPVIGKLLAEQPFLKPLVKEISPVVAQIVKEVNELSLREQREIVEKNWPEALLLKRIEEERRLPPLPNVDKYAQVVTRFSPNPDCAIHLGSARAIILCHMYARMYGGKFYVRFEDTDPKLKRPQLQFYESIKEDLRWLGCEPDAYFIQSDRLEIYYSHAEKLLSDGNAYVCTCKPEKFRQHILSMKPCPCRELKPEAHLKRWEMMLNGAYKEGEAVVRVKTDLQHPNPAVRDWPALRIIDTEAYPHPRVGSRYHVWPLYNLACGVDDHLMGVSHIIRGKEHLTNQTRQEYMYKHFGWKYPEAIHYGRLKITGAFLSKSKIVEGIKAGVFKSWDDPRLATFAALRRRGIQPEAIRRLIVDVGPKTQDITLSWENLYAHNRKIVDSVANRYFFVHDPVRLVVKHVQKIFDVKLHLHPDDPQKGFRSFKIVPKNGEAQFYVSGADAKKFHEGDVVRFMELFNFKIERIGKDFVEATFHSESYEEAKNLGAVLIHWIPFGSGIPCEVVMPDATVASGVVEKACASVKVNDIVQFERFGFVRVDEVNEKLVAFFAHR
ncbi:MAG: glutamate--tRNA ligase [Candidatus Bathyarchaeia archaeon]